LDFRAKNANVYYLKIFSPGFSAHKLLIQLQLLFFAVLLNVNLMLLLYGNNFFVRNSDI